MKKNVGISLIALIITIVVILILVAAIMLEVSNNNMQDQAKEAKFKSNVDSYKSQLSLAISNEYILDDEFDTNEFNAGIWNGGEVENTIKKYIPNITDADAKKFAIKEGKLIYVGTKEKEQNWFASMGATVETIAKPALGVNIIATENSTVDGMLPSYRNPIIPKGFKAINDGITWPSDWNNGLVIEDMNGNQFVWVPVDGKNVKYEKWCNTRISYTLTTDDTLPSVITNEQNQIIKYGGFYIARYEAGKVSNRLVVKSNVDIWETINYVDSKILAESMYTSSELRSGLVTGTQWDTLMSWFQNSGKNITDSRNWGNLKDSISPANVTGYGNIKKTGYSEHWKANNIYDIAGNAWEWSNEVYNEKNIIRGGGYGNNGNEVPSSNRSSYAPTYTNHDVTFRVVLYVL